MISGSGTDFYFQRFGFCPRQISSPPPQDLGLVVVMPCFNEPDLTGSLQSLWQCERPVGAVEVIVVINSAVDSPEAVRSQNRKTLQQAAKWAGAHSGPRLTFHLLDFPDLPAKQAGVGLARKIGMDEAARRFDEARNADGVIISFDADCRCERNYLTSIERHFQKHRRSPACSIYFEHPLAGEGSEADDAIAGYELQLRYYVQALRYAGFPWAHHAIGSCMAIRTEIYTKQGGMNKRQAGEDFYFLQKIIPLGHFTDLTETKVIPSSRPSDRVPFGTGKAVRDFLRDRQSWTYPLQSFLDLKQLFEQLPELFRAKDLSGAKLLDCVAESIRTFLKPQAFDKALKEIRDNTASETAFQKRFFHWFSGFQVMKFIHHARDHFYGKKPVAQEAQKLLSLRNDIQPDYELSVRNLLCLYRKLDRKAL